MWETSRRAKFRRCFTRETHKIFTAFFFFVLYVYLLVCLFVMAPMSRLKTSTDGNKWNVSTSACVNLRKINEPIAIITATGKLNLIWSRYERRKFKYSVTRHFHYFNWNRRARKWTWAPATPLINAAMTSRSRRQPRRGHVGRKCFRFIIMEFFLLCVFEKRNTNMTTSQVLQTNNIKNQQTWIFNPK